MEIHLESPGIHVEFFCIASNWHQMTSNEMCRSEMTIPCPSFLRYLRLQRRFHWCCYRQLCCLIDWLSMLVFVDDATHRWQL